MASRTRRCCYERPQPGARRRNRTRSAQGVQRRLLFLPDRHRLPAPAQGFQAGIAVGVLVGPLLRKIPAPDAIQHPFHLPRELDLFEARHARQRAVLAGERVRLHTG